MYVLNLNLLIDIPVKGFSMTIYKGLKIYEIYNERSYGLYLQRFFIMHLWVQLSAGAFKF